MSAFYNYEEIKQNADCLKIARDVLNLPVSADGRFAAVWRGGDNKTSVSINANGWHDFGSGESGSVIDLVMKVKGFNIFQAQNFLGEYLKLEPSIPIRKTLVRTNENFEELKARGFVEKARYDYCDLQGNLVFQKIRMEHPQEGKTFLQKSPTDWSLKGIVPILYNLKNLHESPWTIIVEGEKDADNLIALGLPATTNFDGAGKWRDSYNQEFDGKDVIILPDNDEPGRKHANLIATKLLTRGKVKSIKIVPTSNAPKGDVSDFFAEGHTWAEVQAKIEATPALSAENYPGSELAVAKFANSISFKNFTSETVDFGEGKKEKLSPRKINDLISEVHLRFLNFPRKVGEHMFDHDRDTGEIFIMDKMPTLFSWIQRKSKQFVEWQKLVGCVTKEELFEGLHATAKRYEAISTIPDWPARDDVYYTCGKLPEADPEHRRFLHFIEFFALASPVYRPLLMAFFAAPLFYKPHYPRPLWIIDSADGMGSGKTTLVELISKLYNHDPVRANVRELRFNFNEFTKRLLSAEARKARIVLLDNVTGNFSCSELAELVTTSSISGRPAYGRGEETRPNNLTYIITSNSASVDNDIASRSFYLMLRLAERSDTWRDEVFSYVEKNRMEIFADIIDILEHHRSFEVPLQTRYPEFESQVLQAFCRDQDEFFQVIDLIAQNKNDSNSDVDRAARINEILRYRIANIEFANINPETDRVFIPNLVLADWLQKEKIFPDSYNISQNVRNLVKIGLLPNIDKKTERYPHNPHPGQIRRRGLLWAPPDSSGEALIVDKFGDGKIAVCHEQYQHYRENTSQLPDLSL